MGIHLRKGERRRIWGPRSPGQASSREAGRDEVSQLALGINKELLQKVNAEVELKGDIICVANFSGGIHI